MSEHERDGSTGSLERGLLGIVVGAVAAALVVIALGPLLQRLYPVDINPLKVAESLQQAPDSLPPLSFALLLAAYAFASFVGGLATSLTVGRVERWPAVVTGIVLMIAGTFGVMAVSQPAWFRAASFLTYPMAYVGHLLVRRSAR